MTHLLIVFHSRTGGARQMAAAAASGASAEIETIVKQASEAGADDLLSAGGYIFVAPENLAAISGAMKEFYDRTYYDVLGRIEGRPYTQMVCAGSDGENALRQTTRIVTGWRLKLAQPPLILCTNAQSKEEILAPKLIAADDLERCRTLGAAIGAGLALGVF